jgi:hypothetical protein
MKTLSSILLALVVCVPAFADDAVAGRSHILMTGRTMWVPLDGSPFRAIDLGMGGAGTSVASDGERFLVTYGGVAFELYEEGEIEPLVSRQLDPKAWNDPDYPAFAIWDGTRYLVAWKNPGDDVRIAVVTRDGALERIVDIEQVRDVSGFAANGDRLLLIEEKRNQTIERFVTKRSIRAAVFDRDFSFVAATVIGSIEANLWTFQRTLDAVPFGDGFYVAWHQGMVQFDGARDAQSKILGTRITASGAAPDVVQRVDSTIQGPSLEGRILVRDNPEAFDADLVVMADKVVAVVKHSRWEGKAPITGTFVAPDGMSHGSRQLGHADVKDDFPYSRMEAVRLRDGRVMAVSVEVGSVDWETSVVTLDVTPPGLPRRRAVR